mmetsp:Transcript_30961/g.67966  ORF Transcript_30961/g.67966 Transcript_30961/m.67966 type:complete len:103 (-) Transcript_30961:63-371(-)
MQVRNEAGVPGREVDEVAVAFVFRQGLPHDGLVIVHEGAIAVFQVGLMRVGAKKTSRSANAEEAVRVGCMYRYEKKAEGAQQEHISGGGSSSSASAFFSAMR